VETDAEGRTRTYTYDALDRVTQVVHTKTGVPAVTVTFAYDQGVNGKGRRTSMSDPSGTTAWEYDLQGRVTKKTQTVTGLATPFVIRYRYDAFGRMDQLTTASGVALNYSYDPNRRVSQINNAATVVVAVDFRGYFPWGPVSTFIFGNNQWVTRTFDNDGHPATYPLSDQSRILGYDDASRLTLNQKSDATDQQNFAYDALDRLTSYVALGTNQSFGYDANGNRSSQVIGATSSTYNTPAGNNRLTSVVSSSGSKLYSYDATGNRTAVSGLEVHNYAYDARGRLSSVDSGATTYLVNGLGQRVKKTVVSPASTTFFAYDEQGKLIGEYNATGGAIQEIVYLEDLPVATLRGAETFYIYADHLGTPRQIINAANQLRWRWDIDAFGIAPADENPGGLGAFGFNLRFPGQYLDRETNLAYNYFRDYDPGIGRYMQSDPIGLKGGTNTYAYVKGNPLRFVDPLGEDCQLTFGISGLLGFQVPWWGNGNGGFFGGGVVIGVTSNGQIITQFSYVASQGVGAFAGVGGQGGFSVSKSDTAPGLSVQKSLQLDANAGLGQATGFSAQISTPSNGEGDVP
jgi:RHS repeat-associated protein